MIKLFNIFVILVVAAHRTSAAAVTSSLIKTEVVSVKVIKNESVSGSYHVNIKVFGQEQNVNLIKPNPGHIILHSNFEVTLLDTDKDGQLIVSKHAASKEYLEELHDKIYIDESTGTVLKVHVGRDGVIGNYKIAHEDDVHVITDTIYDFDSKRIDVNLDVDEQILTYTEREATQNISDIYPELYLVMDSAMYKNLGSNLNLALDYFYVLCYSASLRFQNTVNPKIHLRYTTLAIATDRSQETFITDAELPDGSYDMYLAMYAFGDWMYLNMDKFNKIDIAAVITGIDMSGSIYAVYFLGSACRTSGTRYTAISVLEDLKLYYQGHYYFGRQLGHNLNAPNDVETDCPTSDGYMLGDNTGTPNKLNFSPCSQERFRLYANSDQGACLRTIDAPASLDVGQIAAGTHVSMDEQCRLMFNSEAVADTSVDPSILCSNVKCVWPGYSSETKMPAGDNATCGIGGRCWEGVCVY